MALPQTINAATPVGTDSPSGGPQLFQNIKQFLVDVFGISNNTGYTKQAMTISPTTGAVSIQQTGFSVQDLNIVINGLTSQQLLFNGFVTWNNASEVFTAMKLDVTDVLSDANSLLLDLQVGGSSKFTVDKSGNVTIAGVLTSGAQDVSCRDLTVTRNVLVSNGGTTTVNSTNSAIGRSAATATNNLLNVGADSATLYDVLSSTAAASLYGLYLAPALRMGAAHTAHYGMYHRVRVQDDGTARTLTNLYGVYVAAHSKGASSTVTNAYGLYLETQTVGTNNFSLYSAGDSRIGGDLDWALDNVADIGHSGAHRPRTGYFGTSLVAPTIGPAAAQQHTLPAVSSDTIALLAATQTFTNKTWNGVAIGVAFGGTGAATLTSNGIVIGHGTSALTATALTDGQLLIGDSGGTPVAATLTAGANISISNGAGTITISSSSPDAFTGLGLSNNSGTPNTVLDIAAGAASSSDAIVGDRVMMTITAFTKNMNAAWAAGTGNGGNNAAGTLATSTWYDVFLIAKTDGTTDILADTTLSPTLPSGYTYKRRIGSFLTDGSAHIIAFIQEGDWFQWVTPVLDLSNAAQTANTWTTRALSVPPRTRMQARIRLADATGASMVAVRPTDGLDGNPSLTASPLAVFRSAGSNVGMAECTVLTDTSSQIQTNDSTGSALYLTTIGWWDRRGRG